MKSALDNRIFEIVSEEAARQNVRAFVIGGYVRDWFLQRRSNDIDIVVEGSGIAVAEAVARRVGSVVSVFKNFGTAMLHFHGDEIEFVCEGEDEEEALKALVVAVESGLGE